MPRKKNIAYLASGDKWSVTQKHKKIKNKQHVSPKYSLKQTSPKLENKSDLFFPCSNISTGLYKTEIPPVLKHRARAY